MYATCGRNGKTDLHHANGICRHLATSPSETLSAEMGRPFLANLAKNLDGTMQKFCRAAVVASSLLVCHGTGCAVDLPSFGADPNCNCGQVVLDEAIWGPRMGVQWAKSFGGKKLTHQQLAYPHEPISGGNLKNAPQAAIIFIHVPLWCLATSLNQREKSPLYYFTH